SALVISETTANMKFIADAPAVIYSTMSVLKNTIATDGLDSAAIVINLKDRYNNPITNKQVIIQSLRGTTVDTLTNNGILITNNDGACTAFISSLTAGAAQIKIIRPLELVDSFVTVTFTPTSVYDTNSTISANPTELTADSASISTIRITLKDTNNNLIPNIFVKLASNRGDSDFIMYANGRNDGDTTNAQGEVIAYLKSALAGTATIYVVEPTG
ncbi:MAG TPA: invasin domain 3-containing protein, partial [bacterium]|nr:invasin domain 3-containing protein [bacterium]